MSSRTLSSNPTGWIEPYLRKRKAKTYTYHRYCWQEGRSKIHHRHIRKGKLSLVEAAISNAAGPQAILSLLK